jgi:hypothetical protein
MDIEALTIMTYEDMEFTEIMNNKFNSNGIYKHIKEKVYVMGSWGKKKNLIRSNYVRLRPYHSDHEIRYIKLRDGSCSQISQIK